MTLTSPNRVDMRAPKGPIHPPRRTRRGGAIVELALALPLLLVILLICVDGCRLFFAYTTVTNAARNGALWASDPLANGTASPSQSTYATVTAAALADASNLNPAPTVSVSPAATVCRRHDCERDC